jgi:hypothetical protein
MNAFLAAITAACNAFVAWVAWQKSTQQERDEDEIQILLSRHTPADNLRAQLLSGRVKARRDAESKRPV